MKERKVQILLRLPKSLVEQIDERVKRGGYASRQELIREIIRGHFPAGGKKSAIG